MLLAEVDAESQEFRRLVLVEDKLLRNPEARRQVLGQLLDYAHKMQTELDGEALEERLPREQQGWIAENQERIAASLRMGEFLLLVCGDRIHPRVVALAQPLMNRATWATSLFELGLVSLALYSDGESLLLLPNVVGAVARSTRELTIEVTVRSADGIPLAATARVAGESPALGGDRSAEDRWFAKWEFPDAVQDCMRLLDGIEAAGIPGLVRTANKYGKPKLYLDAPGLRGIEVLRVASWQDAVRDTLDSLVARKGTTTAQRAAVTAFRKALLTIPGADTYEGKVVVPVGKGLAHLPTIRRALADLSAALAA